MGTLRHGYIEIRTFDYTKVKISETFPSKIMALIWWVRLERKWKWTLGKD